MKNTRAFSSSISFHSMTLICVSVVACTDGSFSGGTTNHNAVPQKKPNNNVVVAPTPIPTPVPSVYVPTPYPTAIPTVLPTIPPLVRTPTPVPTANPTPMPTPVAPQPTPVVPQPTPNTTAETGTLTFAVAAVANTENEYQATNPGFRAILKDSAGRLVAAGPMTIDAVMNGQNIDAPVTLGFSAATLKVDMTYVASNIPKSGNGKLYICMAADPTASMDKSACKHLLGSESIVSGTGKILGDASTGDEQSNEYRPFQWDSGRAVVFNVGNQNKITIDGYGNSTGLTGAALPHLATHNAVFAAATGENAAMNDGPSPLVLNLSHSTVLDLTSAWDDKNPVSFDLMNTGKSERVGWIGKGAGLLAIDRNGTGKVENGSELFGEYSARVNETQKKGLGSAQFMDGFSALAQYDANFDGVIDAKDPIFKQLVVWVDGNHDGVSQASELKSLAALHIKAIELDYTKLGTAEKPNTIKDNEVRLVGHYVTTEGKRYEIADVWFRQRSAATAKLEDVFPLSRTTTKTKKH